MSYKLLSFNNPKTKKGEIVSDYLALYHALIQSILGYVLIQKVVAECKEACLNTAGRGGIIKKVRLLM